MPTTRIREARDDDAPPLIALIAAVYAEYPGCVLDVDGEVPHLRRPASSFLEWDGRLWVAEGACGVVGCVGLAGHRDHAELRQLYVSAAARRQGLGRRLCELVHGEALARGHRRIELWTDTRFADAHRLYERLGYVRQPGTRELHDLSRTIEYRYRLALA